MTTIGKWRSPVLTACPDLNWRTNSGPCMDKLTVSTTAYTLAANFAGRGKVGGTPGCGGTDSYVTMVTKANALIDIWAAYRAGIWTSSVTILCYLGGAGGGFRVRAAVGPFLVDKTSLAADAPDCGTTLRATITITDTGAISIV